MALDFEHRGDHASVTFSGEFTVERVLELVNLIDALVDNYFYIRIELVISSPGGSTQAANPFLSAIARWRARGVLLCTRVYSNASSLGAIFFSLGDRRVADPNARIYFHRARITEAQEITVSDTVRMYGALRRLDRSTVKLLVDRALRSTPPGSAAVADTSDGALVSVLARRLSLAGEDASHKARVRALGRYVERAVRRRNRRALKGLYRLVLVEEISLSPHLACALGLADDVEQSAPVPGVHEGVVFPTSALVVPEWSALYPPIGAVPRAAITRHLLALGETGSGKTMSAILPVVAAMASASVDHVRGGLIIDPKRDLAPVLRRLVGDSLQHLDPCDLVVDLMDTPQWRFDDDIAQKRWVTVALTIMLRMRGFAIASPLRVLGPHEAGSSNMEFFDREGCALLRDVLAFLLMLFDSDAPPVSEWFSRKRVVADGASDASGPPSSRSTVSFVARRGATSLPDPTDPRAWLHALFERARGVDDERGVNVVALASWALGTALVQVADDDAPWLWAQIASAARPVFGAEPGEARDLCDRVCAYWRKSSEVQGQHMAVLASARNAASDFADPSVARTIYFGCDPALPLVEGTRVDFASLVACGPYADSAPRFVLYQPDRQGGDSLVAACLKARYFEQLFLDADRQSGRADLPLCVYAADEAHRYLSTGPSGEAHFIDAARSFGCVALLATQSLASVENALELGGGSPTERRATLDIIWTNCGSKLVFRTTCDRTSDHVHQLAPYRPGYAPITRVRPLSALSPGQCYAFLPDGSFGLHQLDAFASTPCPRAARRRKKGKRGRQRSESSRSAKVRKSRTRRGEVSK